MALSIETEWFYEAWWQLLEAILGNGAMCDPRGLKTREHLGVQLRVTDGLGNVLHHPSRNLNYKFMVAEWLWIMSGSDRLETIAQYNSEIRRFSDDALTLSGAYGPRIADQLPWLVARLSESNTRQAIINIWRPCPPPSRDIPCTIALQFLLRQGVLNLIVTMRSSDVWLGLPYDFYVFSQLLNCIAGEIHAEVGFVQFNLGSSHLYESNQVGAVGCFNTYNSGTTFSSIELSGRPPVELLELTRTQNPSLVQEIPDPWRPYAQVLLSPRNEALKWLTNEA